MSAPADDLGAMPPRDLRLPWAAMAAMVVVDAGVQLALWRITGATVPTGMDAQFWGADAAAILGGATVTTFPPVFPALLAACRVALGVDLPAAALVLGCLGALLAAPATTCAATALFGRRAGVVAGWLTLALSDLQASAWSGEPTALFVVGFGGAVAIAAAALRRGDLRGLAGAGVAFGVLAGLKEQGLVLVAFVAPAVASAFPGARWRALGVFLGAAAAVYGLLALPSALQPGPSWPGKVAMPARELARLVTEGHIPSPLAVPPLGGPPVLRLPPGVLARPGVAFAEYVGVQCGRFAWYAGVWTLAVPLAGWGLHRRRRSGHLTSAEVTLVGGLLLLVLAVLVVPVMQRHVEFALLPVAWVVASLTAEAVAWPSAAWSARAAALLVPLLFAQGATLTALRSVPLIRENAADVHARRELIGRLIQAAPPGVPLCAGLAWVAYYADASPRCTADGPGPQAWLLDVVDAQAVGATARGALPPDPYDRVSLVVLDPGEVAAMLRARDARNGTMRSE